MSLTGTWNLSIATPMGPQRFMLKLVQHGPDEISGVSRYEQDDEQELTEPRLTGNELTWKTSITKPMKITATMHLTFDGDSVSGLAKAGILGSAKIVGQRAD